MVSVPGGGGTPIGIGNAGNGGNGGAGGQSQPDGASGGSCDIWLLGN